MDFLINNARLVDCHKKKIFIGGVAVVESRIVEVYNDRSSIPIDHFDRVIDAKGKYLIPAFFDVHSKSDLSAIGDPSRISALSQGIAVEVLGHDGFSVAPVSHKNYMLHSQYVSSGLGNPQLKWKWESVFQYLDNLNLKTATNTLFYSPHGTMRLECSLNPVLSAAGLSALQYVFERSIDDGAIGLSISVSQSPSSVGWNDDKELEVLLKVLQQKDGILCVNVEGSKNHLKDIDKAINLARNYGIRLHISRLTPNNSEQLDAMLSILDRRKKDAKALIVDVSPYPSRLLRLHDVIPESIKGFSSEELRVRFKKQENVRALFAELKYNEAELETLKLVTTSKRDMKKYEEVNVETIAMEKDETIYELMLDLIVSDSEKTFFEHEVIKPETLKKAFELPFVLPATTGYLNGRYLPDMFSTVQTYFSIFSKKDICDLVLKLAQVPADFYGIKWDIKRGSRSNFILMDDENFHSEATYADPRIAPSGVELVVVNGKIASEKGKTTGTRTGEVLSWI